MSRVMPLTRCLTLQPHGSRVPLFCIPGAGGRAHYFDPLVRRLGTQRPVYGLQSYGIESNGEPSTDLPLYAARCLEVIRRQLRPDRPYFLLGHSFGGVVAFEVAHQIQQERAEVGFLAIVDTVAPAEAPLRTYEGWSLEDWQRHIAVRMERHYGLSLNRGAAGPNSAELWLGERMAEQGLVPPGTTPDIFRRFIEVYIANVTSGAAYTRADRFFRGELTLFRAEEDDPDLRVDGITRAGAAMGWADMAAQIEVVEVAGTHLTMVTEPFVGTLAERLNEKLCEADERLLATIPTLR
jgi:thioesterase domain-containing protein